MERQPVESSNIKSVGFADNILEIEFKRGGVYRYAGVTLEIFKFFMESESKGKFLSQYIIPHHVAEKV
jgi:hypothetical protein